MSVLLSHTTALEVIRSMALKSRLDRGERATVPLPEKSPGKPELMAVLDQFPQLSLPLHVSAARRGHAVSPRLACVHRSRVALPAGSAIRLSNDIYCSSPEHLVVQMAPSLTRLEVIFLLGELLGTYAIAPDHEEGMFSRRQPLTTRERVFAHLDALGPVPGTAQVRSALSAACERSASPYETRLSMRLGLKPALGGYHLRVLSMNAPLEVMRIGSALGPGTRKPDVLLGSTNVHAPFSGVSFDYNGGIHRTPDAFERDARRQNEMLAVDFKNYVLTKSLYDDLDYMDDIVARARSDLGVSPPHLTRDEALRRRIRRAWLHDELELIDGIHWNGRDRERRTADSLSEEPPSEVVPLDAYGLA